MQGASGRESWGEAGERATKLPTLFAPLSVLGMVTKISKKPLNRNHTSTKLEQLLAGVGRVMGTQSLKSLGLLGDQWQEVPLGRCS